MQVVPINDNSKAEKQQFETASPLELLMNKEGKDGKAEGNKGNSNKTEKNIAFFSSISFCLTTVISLSVVLSIFLITAVWVSTFSASLIALADSNRRNEFNKLETYLRQSIKDIENFGETASHVLSKELEFYDFNKTEALMYSLWRAQYINTNGLAYLIFILNSDGVWFGFARFSKTVEGDPVFIVLMDPAITGTNYHFYFCYNFPAKEYCDRTRPIGSPDLEYPGSGNNFILYNKAIPYIGKKVWTLLYEDAATPMINHMNMLIAFNTSHVKDGKDNAVFAYDFSLSSMNYYLNESTYHLPGAAAIVLETPTGKFISTNNKIDCATDACDSLYYPPSTLEVNKFLFSYCKQNLTNLICNTHYSVTYANRYVNIMRICTENGIDWVLVLSVEQWYYIGNIVIAIVAAVVASIVIVITGVVVGIYFSSRIVAPFKQLIHLFSLVSNMELQDLEIPKSFFSEVKLIMFMFNEMVSRMKLYRSFIPSFLLTQLEEKMTRENQTEIELSDNQSILNLKEHDSSFSRKESSQHSSFKANNKMSYLQKFELGLENKNVTVVGLRLNNFEIWVEGVNTKDIVSMTTMIFQTVQQLAKPGKGQVGSFDNGFLSISFNAALDADNHELKGCNIAKAITQKLMYSGNNEGPLPFTVYCAVVTDSVACGNLGTTEIKMFSILGDVEKKITKMLKKNTEFEVPITVSEKVQISIKEQFLVRCIEEITFRNFKGKEEGLSVYELGDSLHVSMDEWMYEMEQKESKNKWNNYNAGFSLYKKGNYEEAIQNFEEHLLRNPNDKIGKNMIKKCQQ